MKISQLASEILSHDVLSPSEKNFAECTMLRLLVMNGVNIQFLKECETPSSRASKLSAIDETITESMVKMIAMIVTRHRLASGNKKGAVHRTTPDSVRQA